MDMVAALLWGGIWGFWYKWGCSKGEGWAGSPNMSMGGMLRLVSWGGNMLRGGCMYPAMVLRPLVAGGPMLLIDAAARLGMLPASPLATDWPFWLGFKTPSNLCRLAVSFKMESKPDLICERPLVGAVEVPLTASLGGGTSTPTESRSPLSRGLMEGLGGESEVFGSVGPSVLLSLEGVGRRGPCTVWQGRKRTKKEEIRYLQILAIQTHKYTKQLKKTKKWFFQETLKNFVLEEERLR